MSGECDCPYRLTILEARDQMAVLVNGTQVAHSPFSDITPEKPKNIDLLPYLAKGSNRITVNGIVFTEKKGSFKAEVYAPSQSTQIISSESSPEKEGPGLVFNGNANVVLSSMNCVPALDAACYDAYGNLMQSWEQVLATSAFRIPCDSNSSSRT